MTFELDTRSVEETEQIEEEEMPDVFELLWAAWAYLIWPQIKLRALLRPPLANPIHSTHQANLGRVLPPCPGQRPCRQRLWAALHLLHRMESHQAPRLLAVRCAWRQCNRDD